MQKFTIYCGLFDKETKKQEINTIDAFKIAQNLFIKYCEGVTISEAHGIYTHDDGTVVIEPTLRCEVFGSENQIKSVSSELKTVLNQESVIIEEAQVISRLF